MINGDNPPCLLPPPQLSEGFRWSLTVTRPTEWEGIFSTTIMTIIVVINVQSAINHSASLIQTTNLNVGQVRPPPLSLAPTTVWPHCTILKLGSISQWSEKKTTELLSKNDLIQRGNCEFICTVNTYPPDSSSLTLHPIWPDWACRVASLVSRKDINTSTSTRQKRYQHKFSRGDGFDLCDMCLSKGNKLASSVDAIAISKSETDPLSVNHYRI